jgi:hypothetical protein
MKTETEIIDRLFLELSQFSQATTARETQLIKQALNLRDALRETLTYIEHNDGTTIKQREVDSRWKRWCDLAHKSNTEDAT